MALRHLKAGLFTTIGTLNQGKKLRAMAWKMGFKLEDSKLTRIPSRAETDQNLQTGMLIESIYSL
jgi:hypothetical protein